MTWFPTLGPWEVLIIGLVLVGLVWAFVILRK